MEKELRVFEACCECPVPENFVFCKFLWSQFMELRSNKTVHKWWIKKDLLIIISCFWDSATVTFLWSFKVSLTILRTVEIHFKHNNRPRLFWLLKLVGYIFWHPNLYASFKNALAREPWLYYILALTQISKLYAELFNSFQSVLEKQKSHRERRLHLQLPFWKMTGS